MTTKLQYSDQQLIQMIRSKGGERDRAFRFIFQQSDWSKIAQSKLLARGVSVQDAEDAIMDSIIILDNNIRNFKFEGKSSLKTYFIGICLNKWWTNHRREINKKTDLTDDNRTMDQEFGETPDVIMFADELKEKVRTLLQEVDRKCQNVLKLYMLNNSNAEIAEKLAFSSPQMAKKAAYRCRMKLRKILGKNPTLENSLKDLL